MWIDRNELRNIKALASTRPAVLVTGARQVGKSSLLQKAFADYSYVTLDRVAQAREAEESPSAFLDRIQAPAILDEVQYAPSLFRELKMRIDDNRDKYGQWILTGSQRFSLMKNVSDSLAGRIGILHLESLCTEELRRVPQFESSYRDIEWKGGYPELWANEGIRVPRFFDDYVQTYLERDLKALINVSSLSDFQRFIKAMALRVGQLINFNEIARDIGVSGVTVKSWVSALDTSGLIYLVPPYYRNLGKRLVKTPKVYFADTGLACYLAGVESMADYEGHIHLGHLWENFVFTELVKSYGLRPGKDLFFYRDQNGVEIDFVVEKKSRVTLVEVKSSEQPPSGKLNFRSVAPLLGKNVRCQVLCRTKEEDNLKFRDYNICNPLLWQRIEF